ncbi:MAG: hypothetical protein ACE5E4_06825 [Candidatus Binatia bacterium]
MKTLLVALTMCVYSFPVTALAAVYDFSSNAGVDRFAFGESLPQTSLPPSTNDIPAVPVASSDYAAMATLNSQYHSTPVFEGGESAAVRYVFTIDEPAALITEMTISWDGGANEDGGVRLWAWNAANGGYVSLGWPWPSSKAPPGGNVWRQFTTNAAEFVAADNTVTLLAAYTTDGARLMTDYLSVTVTQTSGCGGDADCDDGLYCNGVETCDPVVGCQPGTPIDCNDGIACTDDFCNDTTASCDHAANDSVCQNGLFCDGSEVCDPVLDCRPGLAVNCDDGIPCTTDYCNEATKYCDNVPDGPGCFVSNRWYVDADATGANDGSSWANALNLLQEALAMAAYGDEIWVAAGTYRPDEGAGQVAGDREATFTLRNGVALYGHFLGNEAALGDRVLADLSDPLRQTILSGDIGVAGYALDNSHHVVTASAADAVVFDAFTVSGGMAGIGVVPYSMGGGMLIVGGMPAISNCSFTANQAPGGGGVGVYFGTPTFSNCVFSNNLAGDVGGGLYNLSGDVSLVGCEFRFNQADISGGGMADMSGASRLTDCSFIGNSIAKLSGAGGGMYTGGGSRPTLTNCLFAGNSAPNGGGMFNWGSPVVVNCTFSANSSSVSRGGGLIQIGSLGQATNSIFWGNTSGGLGSLESAQISGVGLDISFSAVEGWSGALGGVGNTGADPLFADAAAGDYSLLAGSACIDAGDNSAVPGTVLADLAGAPRFVDDGATPDTGLGLAPLVDMGAYEFSPASCLNDADCDDGVFCNGAETCSALQLCEAGVPVDCDDGVACTVDSCDDALGSCLNLPNAAACGNGVFCDGVEVCDALLGCQAGVVMNCDDGVGCTIDSCNETTQACDNLASAALCDNGLFCDGAEVCDTALGCRPGGDPCPGEFCDEVAGACVGCTTDADCDDGIYCDGAESCDPLGACQPGTPVVCDDGVGCTLDSCNEATASCDNVASDLSCHNGVFCDGTEVCDPVLGCRAGSPVDCNDGVGCTVDSCNETTGSCDNSPDDALCSNGVFCDGVEKCSATLGCQVGTAPDCAALTDQCNVGICDEAAAACVANPVVDGSACNNGDACSGDVCVAGICQAEICGPAPPAAPWNLKAGMEKAVEMEWKPSAGPNVAGYRVYRSNGSGGPYLLAAALGVTTAYAEAPPPGYYCYVVTAVNNSGGESVYSNEVCGTVVVEL